MSLRWQPCPLVFRLPSSLGLLLHFLPEDRQLTTPDKATWFGCGLHVPMVMDQVPEQDRCGCEPKVEKDGKLYPPKADKPN